MKEVKVFIVDDHPMVIEGLASMIRQHPGVQYMGYATSAASCLGYFVQGQADVILMDINLPDKTGMDLCRELKERYSFLNVLAVSSYDQGSYVKDMMEQGASGYIFKNAPKEELLQAIFQISSGQQYLSREASFAMREEKKRLQNIPLLTKREKEVLQLIAEGLTNPQMADKLFISQSTIESHRKSLMAKLDTSNTVALLKAGVELGFLKK